MKIAWKRRQFPETPLDAPLPEGTVISYGEGIWMEKGPKFHVHRTKRWESPKPDVARISSPHILALEGKVYSSWGVYNGEYFAIHNSKLPGRIQLFPQDTLDAKLGSTEGELFPYPLKWGFGFGTGYLDTEYEKSLSRDKTRWERVDLASAEGPRIKLTRCTYFERLGYEIRTDFVVAPEQGFLLTSVVVWDPPGVRDTQIDMTLCPLGDGRWYPAQATKRRLDDFHEYAFSEVRLNPNLDDTLFTIDAFDLDFANTRVHRRKLGNSETRMLFREGQWIPEPMVPKHLRPVFADEDTKYSVKEFKSISE